MNSIAHTWDIEPLNLNEIKKGSALRIAGFYRMSDAPMESNNASYLLVVLLLSNKNKKRNHLYTIEIYRYRGRMTKHVQCLHYQAAISQDKKLSYESKEDWLIGEYHIPTSPDLIGVRIQSSNNHIQLGKKGLQKLREKYWSQISNAAVYPKYDEFLEAHRAKQMRFDIPQMGPSFSIVTPVFNTPIELLDVCVKSVLKQTYHNFELLLINGSPDNETLSRFLEKISSIDSRIKVHKLNKNLGIVGNTNVGIEKSKGDFVCFLDHDDILEPFALAAYVRAINSCNEEPSLLYCDEDNIDVTGNHYFMPIIKQDFSPDYLESNNYILHFLCINRNILKTVHLSTNIVNGAQDYDLTFKAVEKNRCIVHVPAICYHWRISETSTAQNPLQKSYAQEAGRIAIDKHIARTGLQAEVKRAMRYFEYVTSYSVNSANIHKLVILNQGTFSPSQLDFVEQLNKELPYYIETQSKVDVKKFLEIYEKLKLTERVLLLSEDCIIPVKDLISLLGFLERSDVFAISPKIINSDGLLHYCGGTITHEGYLLRLLQQLPETDGGYLGHSFRNNNTLVLSSCCCLIKPGQKIESNSFTSLDYLLASMTVHGYKDGIFAVYNAQCRAQLLKPRSIYSDAVVSQDEREEIKRYLQECFSKLETYYDPFLGELFDGNNPYYKLIPYDSHVQ